MKKKNTITKKSHRKMSDMPQHVTIPSPWVEEVEFDADVEGKAYPLVLLKLSRQFPERLRPKFRKDFVAFINEWKEKPADNSNGKSVKKGKKK